MVSWKFNTEFLQVFIHTFMHTWKMAKKKSISNICSNFGSSTSVHGIPHLISAKSFKSRIFWSIVCLASSAMFLYLLSKLITKYYSYPIVIKIHQVGLNIALKCFATVLSSRVKTTAQNNSQDHGCVANGLRIIGNRHSWKFELFSNTK